MSDFDRELIETITDLDGAVCELRDVVAKRGAAHVARVIADGIAAVFHATDKELFACAEPWGDAKREALQYLPSDEALLVVQLPRIPEDFRIVLETLDPQLDGSLMFRYAADDPAAIAEVRTRRGRE